MHSHKRHEEKFGRGKRWETFRMRQIRSFWKVIADQGKMTRTGRLNFNGRNTAAILAPLSRRVASGQST